MRVILNGEDKEVADDLNLSELLESLRLPAQRIAIELNKQVVRKKDWPAIRVREADRIEIVHFVGGG